MYQKRKRAGRTGEERLAEKDYQLKYNFGISLVQYKDMLEKQNYSCAICGKRNGLDLHRPGAAKELSVDHCHRTGQVRGLLCSDCNRGIGQLQDSPEIVRRAAEYLEQYAKIHGRAALEADDLLEELVGNIRILSRDNTGE